MQNKKRKMGFTLVEIMVAIVILLVLVLGVANVLYQVGGTVHVQGNTRMAMDAVDDLLEAVTSQDQGSLSDFSTNIVKNGVTYSVQATVVDDSAIRSTVNISISYKNQSIQADTVAIAGVGIIN